MGVETPIPPVMIGAAAPDGAPPRRINTVHFFRTDSVFQPQRLTAKNFLPRRAPRGALGRGAIISLVACSITLIQASMTRKNRRKPSGPPFRKEALMQETFVPIGPFNDVHPSGMNSSFLPVSAGPFFFKDPERTPQNDRHRKTHPGRAGSLPLVQGAVLPGIPCRAPEAAYPEEPVGNTGAIPPGPDNEAPPFVLSAPVDPVEVTPGPGCPDPAWSRPGFAPSAPPRRSGSS